MFFFCIFYLPNYYVLKNSGTFNFMVFKNVCDKSRYYFFIFLNINKFPYSYILRTIKHNSIKDIFSIDKNHFWIYFVCFLFIFIIFLMTSLNSRFSKSHFFMSDKNVFTYTATQYSTYLLCSEQYQLNNNILRGVRIKIKNSISFIVYLIVTILLQKCVRTGWAQ